MKVWWLGLRQRTYLLQRFTIRTNQGFAALNAEVNDQKHYGDSSVVRFFEVSCFSLANAVLSSAIMSWKRMLAANLTGPARKYGET